MPERAPAMAVEAAVAPVEPAVAATAAPVRKRKPRGPQAAPPSAIAPAPPAPVTATVAAKASPPAAEAAAAKQSKALLKREGDLDAALEAVVDFVDGQPRRVRAQACADTIAGLVPKSRRGPAQTRFEAAVKSGAAPGELQDLAESVGIELARALHAVREEIKTQS